jgi:hypothetical protein
MASLGTSGGECFGQLSAFPPARTPPWVLAVLSAAGGGAPAAAGEGGAA